MKKEIEQLRNTINNLYERVMELEKGKYSNSDLYPKEVKPTKPDFKVKDWVIQGENIGRISAIADYKLFLSDTFIEHPSGTFWVNPIVTRHATTEEITKHLTEEAIKRGFKKGVRVSWGDGDILSLSHNECNYYKDIDSLCMGNWRVYHNGTWAEIIDDVPVINGHKMEVDHNQAEIYIKFGCKEKYRGAIEEIDSDINIFNQCSGCKITALEIDGEYKITVDELKQIVNCLNKK